MIIMTIAFRVYVTISELCADQPQYKKVLLGDKTAEKFQEDICHLHKEFFANCKKLDGSLTDETIEKMFLGYVDTMFRMKLFVAQNLDRSSVSKIAQLRMVPQEGYPKVMWSPAFDEAMADMAENLEMVFEPLRKIPQSEKTNLYSTPKGRAQAELMGSLEKTPVGSLMDSLWAPCKTALTPYAFSDESVNGKRDTTLVMLMWNALSKQYVKNSKGDIRVYIPSALSSSSVFWNTELPEFITIKEEDPARKISFYSLTSDALKLVNIYEAQIATMNKKISEFVKDPVKNKAKIDKCMRVKKVIGDVIKEICQNESSWMEVPYRRAMSFWGEKANIPVAKVHKMGVVWKAKAKRNDLRNKRAKAKLLEGVGVEEPAFPASEAPAPAAILRQRELAALRAKIKSEDQLPLSKQEASKLRQILKAAG